LTILPYWFYVSGMGCLHFYLGSCRPGDALPMWFNPLDEDF
jgi:hypothetical protein